MAARSATHKMATAHGTPRSSNLRWSGWFKRARKKSQPSKAESPDMGDLRAKSPDMGDLRAKSPDMGDLRAESPDMGDSRAKSQPLKEEPCHGEVWQSKRTHMAGASRGAVAEEEACPSDRPEREARDRVSQRHFERESGAEMQCGAESRAEQMDHLTTPGVRSAEEDYEHVSWPELYEWMKRRQAEQRRRAWMPRKGKTNPKENGGQPGKWEIPPLPSPHTYHKISTLYQIERRWKNEKAE